MRLAVHYCRACPRQSGSAFGMATPVTEDGLMVIGFTKQFSRIADSGNTLSVCSVVIAGPAPIMF